MKTKPLSLDEELTAELDAAREQNLYRALRVQGQGAGGQDEEVLNFADNDYLGLARHPRVVQAFKDAAEKYGTGSGASRLISGTSEAHDLLEKQLAAFKQKEKALVYGSGYLANLGIISALAGKKDLVLIDKLNHASIIDGCRLSGAALRVYPHKNLKKLEALLEKSSAYRRTLIVTDSVFSMDGDLAPLAELAELKEKYGAVLMIDEAHGTGVFGKNGRGAAEHLGAEAGVDISMGTLSKALGVLGGYVAGSAALIDYFVNFSRPFIFATALPGPLMAASGESLRVIGEEPALREKLWKNVARVRAALAELKLKTGGSESPIIPILIGAEDAALKAAAFLREKGIFIPAIRYPTVARGQARLRLTVSARHSQADLDRLFTALRQAVKLL